MNHSESTATKHDSSTLQPALFATMLSVYAMHNLTLRSGFWFTPTLSVCSSLGWAAFLAAVALFLRPTSSLRLLLLVVSWTGFLGCRFPNVVNHEMATFFLFGIFLVTYLVPSRHRDAGRRFWDFAQVGRWFTLLLYFFVVFHKLNSDYFAPDFSCAWVMYHEIAEWTRLFPDWEVLQLPMIAGVLIMEASLPLLLLFERTRHVGVLFGILFHASLALHTNIFVGDFSLLMMTLFTLFIPSSAIERSCQHVQRCTQQWSVSTCVRNARWKALGLLAVLILAMRLAIGDGIQLGSRFIEFQQFSNRLLYGLAALGFLVLGCLAWPRSAAARWTLPHSNLCPTKIPGIAMLGLAAVWGMQPYFGFGTYNVFAMFSNVRFEEGRNHWIMPESLRVAHYGNDIVELVDSSDPSLLVEKSARRQRLAWRTTLSRHPDPRLRVTLLDHGRPLRIDRAESPTHEIFQPVPLHLRWMAFRALPPPTGCAPCQH